MRTTLKPFKFVLFKNFKYKNQLKKILMNYIVIFMTTVLVTMVGHITTITLTRMEITRESNQQILQTKSLCDGYLSDLESTAMKLLSTPSVQSLALRTVLFDYDQAIYNAIASVKLTEDSNPLIRATYLVYNNRDLCIDSASVYNKQVFYDMHFAELYASQDACIGDLSDFKIRSFKLLEDQKGNKQFLYLYNYASNFTVRNEIPVFAVFELDFSVIMGKIKIPNSGEYLIFNQDGRLIYRENDELHYWPALSDTADIEELDYEGKTYRVNSVASDKFPLKYVHVIEKSIFAKLLITLNTVIIGSYVICLIAVLVIAVFFAKRNYISLSTLMDKSLSDEKLLEEQAGKLRHSALINYLSGKLEFNEERLREHGIVFPNPYYAVLIFNILDFGITDKATDKTALFCISNVFSELLSGVSETYYCEIDGFYVCLLNYGNEVDIALINEKAQFTNEFLNQHFGINFVTVISKMTTHLADIPKLYEQSIDTLANTFLFNNTPAISNEDLSQRSVLIKKYIEEHFPDPDLSVNSIAEHFDLSPNYISKCFKEQTGVGLLKYIITRRITEAKRLLLDTGETISKISEQVGFYNANVFIRTFKKLEGITPREFRKNHNGL